MADRKMIPTVSVTVARDGKTITPPVGQPFDFTQEEIDQANEARPGAIRKPQNESTDETETEDKAKDAGAKDSTKGKAKATAPANSKGDDDL